MELEISPLKIRLGRLTIILCDNKYDEESYQIYFEYSKIIHDVKDEDNKKIDYLKF